MRLEIVKVKSSTEWDAHLVTLGGHPLQSALWGDARRACDGIHDERWLIMQDKLVLALLRMEHRGIGPLSKLVAWVPQGPVLNGSCSWDEIKEYILKVFRNKYGVLVILSWKKIETLPDVSQRKTVWVDLLLGEKQLWSNLDKQWRYGAKRAGKLGVLVKSVQSKEHVEAFFKLCQQVSNHKKFKLNGSVGLLHYLLNNNETAEVEAKLFLATLDNALTAGAFILRVGKTVHYMWGAVDRKYSKERVGEFIQWHIISWACAAGYHRYDLEGIDEVANPGVASFKKKMGGEIIALPGKAIYPLSKIGSLAAKLIKN